MLFWIALVIGIACVVAVFESRVRRPRSHTRIRLVEAERAHRPLETRPLPAGARQRYVEAWQSLQGRFKDEPEIAVREADRLVQAVMRECGYPTGDFGRVAEELSAEQREVIDDYRVAHRISVKSETSSLSDDEVGRAVAALGALFEKLTAS
jgi:hypothetical protein